MILERLPKQKNLQNEINAQKNKLTPEILPLPDDAIQHFVRYVVERDFLNDLQMQQQFRVSRVKDQPEGWIQILELPISPSEANTYTLFSRWQNVLATLHTLEYRACYLLLRTEGVTKLYLGALPTKSGVKAEEVSQQLQLIVNGQMPGIGAAEVRNIGEFKNKLSSLKVSGAVTGIPAPRKNQQFGQFQTMDQIAMGIDAMDANNIFVEKDFAVLINALPIQDSEIVSVLRTMENLVSEIHALTQYSQTKGTSEGGSISVSSSTGTNIGGSVNVGGKILEIINAGVSAYAGEYSGRSDSVSTTVGKSDSVSFQYINKSAMYCEELLEKHIARLKSGRAMGFWKTGVYVLADDDRTVRTIMGMLRAVYSGDESYVEPIRTTMMPTRSGADEIIRHFQHIPHDNKQVSGVIGRIFEDYATPMTTAELSIASGLPRRDVNGLRLVKTAVEFSANAPDENNNQRQIHIGNLINMGANIGLPYNLDIDQLTRHALLVGLNGSGKTTTVRKILSGVMNHKMPFLVIDPIKTDYLEWAIAYNKKHEKEKGFRPIRLYMPGYQTYRWFDKEHNQMVDIPLDQLKLNAYKPLSAKGTPMDMMGHLDSLAAILSASMSMGEVLPMLLQEAMHIQAMHHFGQKNGLYYADSHQVDAQEIESFPHFRDLLSYVTDVMENRNYSPENKGNLTACMETRINSLLRGWKADFFDAEDSTDPDELFGENAVVCLYGITDNQDKALAMSLLLLLLREYRTSKYMYDEKYRKQVDIGRDHLMHFTVVEEAHRILMKPEQSVIGVGNPQAVVANLFNEMLSEVRAYGEGLMIVDQYPSRLVADAIKNTNLKIVHKLQAQDDRQMVGGCMGLKEDQMDMIAVLEKGNTIVSSEQMDTAIWVKVDNKHLK